MLARIRPLIHFRSQIWRSISHTTAVRTSHANEAANPSIDDIISQINKLDNVVAPIESEPSQESRTINVLLHRLNALPQKISVYAFGELPIFKEIEDSLGNMGTNEVISVMSALGSRSLRFVDLITHLSERLIRLRQDITADQITTLALSLRQLSFYSPRFIKYLVSNFVNRVNDFNDWSQISTIAYCFSHVKVNSPTFWIAFSEVMNANLESAADNIKDVQRTIASCAVVNMPTHLIQKPIDLIVEDLKNNPKVRASANDYLNIVHGLAILKSLSNYEANKVLQPEFFDEIQNQYKTNHYRKSELPRDLRVRLMTRILQIGACCRYDMGIEPKISPDVLKIAKENELYAEKLRHGNSVLTTLMDFHQNFYITAPLGTHSLSPHLDISTGTFIDAIVYVCPKRRIILPISEGEKSPDAEKVAVIFGSYGLLTVLDAGALTENGCPLSRPLGETKMNLRHLRAKKFKPVLIDYFTLSTLQTNAQKIVFIKESIVKPYEDETKDWMSPPLMFFPASDDFAISSKSVSELLGNNLQVLTYTIKFNQASDETFAFGFSKLSPMDSYDYEDVKDVVTVLELDNDEPNELRPPYAKETIMYVNIWRKAKDANYVHIAIKIGDLRSGTYAFECKACQDYFAVHCKPALLIGGLINCMNTEQFLEGHENTDHRCIFCIEKPAKIYYETCGHIAYCEDCCKSFTNNMNCPFCALPGLSIENKILQQSLFCVNCVNKRCTDLRALNLPCKCLVSCAKNVRLFEPCPLCSEIVAATKEVFLS